MADRAENNAPNALQIVTNQLRKRWESLNADAFGAHLIRPDRTIAGEEDGCGASHRDRRETARKAQSRKLAIARFSNGDNDDIVLVE